MKFYKGQQVINIVPLHTTTRGTLPTGTVINLLDVITCECGVTALKLDIPTVRVKTQCRCGKNDLTYGYTHKLSDYFMPIRTDNKHEGIAGVLSSLAAHAKKREDELILKTAAGYAAEEQKRKKWSTPYAIGIVNGFQEGVAWAKKYYNVD